MIWGLVGHFRTQSQKQAYLRFQKAAVWSPLMALTLGMLLPPRYAAPPWHATLPGHGNAPLGMLLPLWKSLQLGQSALKQVTFAHQLFNFQKKVTVWGGG